MMTQRLPRISHRQADDAPPATMVRAVNLRPGPVAVEQRDSQEHQANHRGGQEPTAGRHGEFHGPILFRAADRKAQLLFGKDFKTLRTLR